jgi:LacI family transcriptional regulator
MLHMDPVNLKKLAEQLSLSVSTVSKAFRNSYDINQQTKDRILALAKELNYQPNPLASSLRTQKSHTIAVILPEIANSFFTLAINGIESVAHELGYHVLIYLTHEDHFKEVAFTNHLQSGRVDGVIMSLSEGTKECTHLDHLREKGIPVVFFDRIYENCATTKVTTNDYQSGYAATKHLIEQGCRKIAHLRYAQDLSITQKRMEGYIQALKDHDIPFNREMVIRCINHPQEDLSLIMHALESLKPDGIFSSFEKLAMLTYQACSSLKIEIPKKLKIISFSNLETAPLLQPSLTTITQPAFEIGEKAASVLFRALKTGALTIPDEQIIIDSVLIKRQSTAR